MAEEEARELLLDLDGVVWTAIGQPLVDEGETPLLIGSDCIETRRHMQAMSLSMAEKLMWTIVAVWAP